MIEHNNEQQIAQEFAEFIATTPIPPASALDEIIIKRVERDLRPVWWQIWSKLTLVQVVAGLLTLSLCPQFGLGFGLHNEFLHTLHVTTTSPIFYLLCGLLFVSAGATLAGLILPRAAIRAFSQQKYLFFTLYTVLAYITLVTLGSEAFILSSLAWMVGGWLGNLMMFSVVTRLRLLQINIK